MVFEVIWNAGRVYLVHRLSSSSISEVGEKMFKHLGFIVVAEGPRLRRECEEGGMSPSFIHWFEYEAEAMMQQMAVSPHGHDLRLLLHHNALEVPTFEYCIFCQNSLLSLSLVLVPPPLNFCQ
jgi:hypothetical protein